MKSPSGSTFPYYYKNGVIHAVKLSGCKRKREKVKELLEQEKEFTLLQNQTKTIWIDLYSTVVTGDLANDLISFIRDLSIKINKIAFVGCGLFARQKIKKRMRAQYINYITIQFFSNPEEAKNWLVGR
ncbi:MAG: hypothetical protein PF637_05240 [Spirochaetes bacterium]|jgi:hypothetical protein|nr:hypothetical protein [Spirochaetota bacterium]